jgi:quercetin dioxygenase-like cupin family protein
MFAKEMGKRIARSTMDRKAGKLLAGVLIACALGSVGVDFAGATPPLGFTAENIIGPVVLTEIHTKSETDDHITIKSKDACDVYITKITITPGGHGGWHSHRGPSIITVKAGTATFYDDCDNPIIPREYTVGMGFVEDAGCVHLLANEGTTNLEVVVIQMVPFGAPRRNDEPTPN